MLAIPQNAFTFALDTSTELMSGVKSRERINEWCQITKVGAPETNQPTNQPTTVLTDVQVAPTS